jgi:hypothetical protein
MQDAARRGYDQSRWYTIPSDITDHQPQPPIYKGEEVVEVAADLFQIQLLFISLKTRDSPYFCYCHPY